MLTNGLLSIVDGRVEGLHLADSLATFDHVVAEFPGETLGPFHAANRTLLIAAGGRIQHWKTLSWTALVYQRGFPGFYLV